MNNYLTSNSFAQKDLAIFDINAQYDTKPKKGTCYHITSFFLKLCNYTAPINDIIVTTEKSIILLDELARAIDSKMDSAIGNAYINNEKLSIKEVSGLEQRIDKCLLPLFHQSDYSKIRLETLLSIDESFKMNSIERGRIYSLDPESNETQTTMGYLLPLFKYLNNSLDLKIDISRIFVLISTYIQILDDYIDIYDDIKHYNETPLTIRFGKLGETPLKFHKITAEVLIKLDAILSRLITHEDIVDSKQNIFSEWIMFHKKINEKRRKYNFDNNKDVLNFIGDMRSDIPPMLCYT